MSNLTLELADIQKFVNVETGAPRNRVYRLVGRNTVDKLRNKDLSDPSNNLGASSYTNFTVSNNSGFKAKYTSIQAAIDAATLTGFRETVIIMPGTYTEDIILKDRVNIEGTSQSYELIEHITDIIGHITHDLSDQSEVSLAHFSVRPDDLALTLDGTNTVRVTINNVYFSTTSLTGSTIVSSGANCIPVFNDCTIAAAGNIINLSSGNLAVFKNSILGDSFLGLPQVGKVLITAGIVSAVYCNGRAVFDISGGALLLANSFMTCDNQPMFTLSGAGMFLMNCSAFTDGTGDIIVGSGQYNDGGAAFTGRTLIQGSITQVPITIPVFGSGDYTATITPVTGATSPALDIARYSRHHHNMTVSFQFTFTSDAVLDSVLTMNLPVARPAGNFSLFTDAIGTAVLNYASSAQTSAVITALSGSQTVQIIGKNDGIAEACTMTGSFTYLAY